MDIEEFAKNFIEAEAEAFHKGNFEPLSRIENPNIVYHMPPLPDMVGHKATSRTLRGRLRQYQILTQEWKYLAGDGNIFALSYKSGGRVTGEKPGFPIPIGKKIATDYLFVLQVKNGKIAEAWANGTFKTDLGIAPE